MDSKPGMPEIKAEVNQVDDGKKKAAGLLSGLFGAGGSGAAGGLGGMSAGAAGAGGLLATKAGMLALIVMGSAVAGGIGLAGYKAFGPGEADKAGGNLSLFAPRTQPAADPNAVAPVNADGSSASLDYIAAAAAKDKAAEAAAAAASASADAPAQNTAGDPVKDAAAADAARMAAEAKAASGGAINAGSGSGAAGSMGRGLANVKKLGALSGAPAGGGSTSAGSGSGANVKLGENIANASKNGATSAFSRQGGGSAKTSSASRSVGGRSTGARTALRQVGVDQQRGRANSSAAAGRTYDGSSPTSGSAIGADGSAIGMDGVGDGAGAQSKSMPANAKGKPNEQDPPVPDAPAKDVTPWAKHVMGGMALGALAIAALLYASSIMKEAKTKAALNLKIMIANIATPENPAAIAAAKLYAEALAELQLAKLLIGAAIAAALGGALLGGMITGEPNGQKLQGGLLIASSLAIATAGTLMMISANNSLTPVDQASTKADSTVAAFSAPSTWMYVIGGLGAVGLVGTMLAPKKTCKSDQPGCHAYIQQQASPTNYTV